MNEILTASRRIMPQYRRWPPAIPIEFNPTVNFIFGAGILICICGWCLLNFSPRWLVWLQSNPVYKQVSGYALLLALLRQVRFGYDKTQPGAKNRVRRLLHFHKWQGALLPLCFYLHALTFGFGYQLLLSIVFLGNVLVGVCSREVLTIGANPARYRRYWLMMHIALAVTAVSLSFYHLYIVYWYA